MGERVASGSRQRSRAASARKEAKDRAARFLEREQRLVDVATDFATASEDMEVARVRQLAAVDVMVNELKVSKAEASERLGISEAEVRSALTKYQRMRPGGAGDDVGVEHERPDVDHEHDGVSFSE